MVTFVDNPNENEDNSTSLVKLQNLGCNSATNSKSLDTISVQSDSSTGSTDSENLVTDGVLISPSQLGIPANGLNIINSTDVHLGDVVHNYGPVTINKQLTIKDLEANSDQRIHKYSIQNNTESDSCDNRLGSTNPSFEPENNCDTQIKTAKLDDGLFIITNKNIENCNINILAKKKPHSRRKLIFTLSFSFCVVLIVGLIILFFSSTTGPTPTPNNNANGKLRSVLLLASPFTLVLLILILIGGVFLYKNIASRSGFRWRQDTDEQDKSTPIDENGKLGSILLLTSPFTFMLLTFILIGGVFLYKNISKWGPDLDGQENTSAIDGTNNSAAGPTKYRIVPRKEWLAQTPKHKANDLNLPVPLVIILHTATENCSTSDKCVFQTRKIQTYHMESRNWWDIAYNFLVGGDGLVYEGRGWYEEGAHTYSYNRKSIGIAFIGTFNSLKPPERQIEAARKLIKQAEEMHILTADYQIIGSRDVDATLSPGQELYNIIQKWPHYSNNIKQFQAKVYN